MRFSCVLDAITALSMVIQWFLEYVSGVGRAGPALYTGYALRSLKNMMAEASTTTTPADSFIFYSWAIIVILYLIFCSFYVII